MNPSFSSSPPVGQLTDLASNPLSIIKARLCSEESQGVANQNEMKDGFNR